MHRLHFLAKNLVETLGQDLATWVVMKAEESYWESKCFSAQIQGLRQSRLGLGWSNHLYHVFRSSRSLFPMLVRICETLGFSIQGASSAGVKEQWAVLCLRNFQAGFNLLIEVDAHPEELTESFGHTPLQDLTMEGPIDKWCRIHGDSILLGGMHHLAIRVMPSELTKATQAYNIKFDTLSPSSIYPFQYFTKEEECVRLEGVCQNNCSGSCLSCISFEHIDPLPLEQDKLYS